MKYLKDRFLVSGFRCQGNLKSYTRRLAPFLALLLLSNFFATIVIAQPKETPDSVRFKVLGCLYRAIGALNSRNVRLCCIANSFRNSPATSFVVISPCSSLGRTATFS